MRRRPLSIRSAWTLWFLSLAFAGICVSVSEVFRRNQDGQIGVWHWALAVLGLWIVSSGYRFRRKLMLSSAKAASTGRLDTALMRWSAAQLFSFMSGINLVVCGSLADLSLHSPVWFGAAFYTAGVVLLLLYRPTSPLTATI